ncbi:MAG: hypothetical protein MJZ02_08250 [Paludibacteraceae bacterium]|nr:hypothetical protein [Paludibacteraceae bacterium]
MWAYITGKISVAQDFVLQNVWFANDDADSTDSPCENCIGLETTGFYDYEFDENDPTLFSIRWKGVNLITADEDGEEQYSGDWKAEDLVAMIKEKGLSIKNLSAFFDEDTEVVITSITLKDDDSEFEFTQEMLEMEPVEFFA